MRVQFPFRTAYSTTINKNQAQTLPRIVLDSRSYVFARGQLYVALSRAQNRQSIMCLLPNEHIVNGTPYTENVFCRPFIEAATGSSRAYLPDLPDLLVPPAPSILTFPSHPSRHCLNQLGTFTRTRRRSMWLPSYFQTIPRRCQLTPSSSSTCRTIPFGQPRKHRPQHIQWHRQRTAVFLKFLTLHILFLRRVPLKNVLATNIHGATRNYRGHPHIYTVAP